MQLILRNLRVIFCTPLLGCFELRKQMWHRVSKFRFLNDLPKTKHANIWNNRKCEARTCKLIQEQRDQNYGKTPASLISLKKQWVWWYNKKGEVNEALKASRFSNCSKTWLEVCFALVVSAGKIFSKKKCDLVKCWHAYTLVRTSYQMEQAWFPGLWEEDKHSMESYVGKLMEMG